MSTPDREPRGRSPWPIIAVAIVVVLGVVITGIILLTRGSSAPETAGPATPPPAAPPAPAFDPGAEGFGTPRSDALGRKVDVPRNGLGVILPQATDQQKSFGDPASRTTPPAGIRWQQTAGVVTPFSTSDGPTRMDGQIPAGYAHTPGGAALAAASILWRLMDGRLAPETAEKQIDMNSKTYAEGITSARAIGTASVGDKMPRPTGYEISDKCEPTYCLVLLTVRLRDGKSQAIPQAMVWSDGDWKATYTEAPGRDGTDPGLIRW